MEGFPAQKTFNVGLDRKCIIPFSTLATRMAAQPAASLCFCRREDVYDMPCRRADIAQQDACDKLHSLQEPFPRHCFTIQLSAAGW